MEVRVTNSEIEKRLILDKLEHYIILDCPNCNNDVSGCVDWIYNSINVNIKNEICPHCHTFIINDGITLCKRCYDKDVDHTDLTNEIEDLRYQLEDCEDELREYQSSSSRYECDAEDLESQLEKLKADTLELVLDFKDKLDIFVEKVKRL